MYWTMNNLLAKNKEQPRCFLTEHTTDVAECAEKIINIYPFLNKDVIKIAALFHDLGKACDGFQRMLSEPFPAWRFRHEVVSVAIYLLYLKANNLSDIDGDSLKVALSILSHHKNLGNSTAINQDFMACMNITQFSQWKNKWQELNIEQLKKEFSKEIQDFPEIDTSKDISSPANEVFKMINKIPYFWDDDSLAFSRAALVTADHLASSGRTSILLGENVNHSSIEKYAKNRIKAWESWSNTQTLSGDTHGSAMLIAPTGAGKTEAALLWATKNRKKHERVFYVLPYQVSINAMASRLSEVFPDENGNTALSANETISIKHSNTDLAHIQDAQNDKIEYSEALKIAKKAKDRARKIYSPVKVTTVYQLLNLFFGEKHFEVGMLELKNSLIIFDEIHAYDGHTLGLVLVMMKYLRKLGARCFIMTATLPNSLTQKLQKASGIADKNVIKLSSDSPLYHEARRTLEKREQKIEELVPEIRTVLNSEKRVAIVCNTVEKALLMCNLLKDFEPYLLHSRFTLKDRAKREQKSKIEEQRLVISTQVIEVSLDVSFEVMFTELAPVDSLIQRFGRVARHGKINYDNLGRCIVACGEDKASGKIYNASILKLTQKYLHEGELNFEKTLLWIESVYPDGLSKDELDKLEKSSDDFGSIVSQLKTMCDPELSVDIEKLFNTVTVIPEKFRDDFEDLIEEGDYVGAKGLTVNVHPAVWSFANNHCGAHSYQKKIKGKQYIFANFEYDFELGLQLNKPIVSIW